ncbi:glycosyltransferase [Rossellomorea vietnamensis]|uniref:glycosyltransferase n=1 Tax=Rossellomorea vietnamensis TaxID=218284 RepID=UPI003D2D9E2A
MKKIVFVTRRMIMGGIEKSLIAMLELIPKNEYEITVLVMSNGGDLVHEVPSHVKIKCLYGNEKKTIEKILNSTRKGKLLDAIKIGWYTYLAKKTDSVFKQESYHLKMLPLLEEEYDIAVAYHVPASLPVRFVMDNLKSKTKMAWIHSDVSHYKRQIERYKDYYPRYDKIFCVSKYARERFIEIFPELKKKTTVFYNIVDSNKINRLAIEGEGYKDEFKGTRVLTVGRLTDEKGQKIIPTVLKKLLLNGFDVRWYCLGEGDSQLEIEEKIKELNLEKNMFLMGTKNNPYPYMKECDIYVQPSKHEGYCITLAEARALNKPIVTTNTIGAMEQIVNGKNGLVVDHHEKYIYKQLINLITNKQLSNRLINNLSKENKEHNYNICKLIDV